MENFISYQCLTSKTSSFQKKINPSPSLLGLETSKQQFQTNSFMDGLTIINLCSFYQNKSSNIIVSHRQTLTEYGKS